MALTNCVTCGQVFLSNYEKLCKVCARLHLDDARAVKEYLRLHPGASVLEVYHRTGVSLKTIRELSLR